MGGGNGEKEEEEGDAVRGRAHLGSSAADIIMAKEVFFRVSLSLFSAKEAHHKTEVVGLGRPFCPQRQAVGIIPVQTRTNKKKEREREQHTHTQKMLPSSPLFSFLLPPPLSLSR